jgi:hypothetical protein
MRTMYRASRIIATLLVGTSLAVACGGDDDDGGGDVSTGIAPSTLLSDISAEQAAQACERLAEGFDSRLSRETLVRTICTLAGAAVADTPEDCETARDECITSANDPSAAGGESLDVDEIQFECDGEGAADLTECTSTVGELETCFNDLLDQISTALNAVSCDDAATVGEEDIDGFQESTFEAPASCEVVDCGEGSPFGPGDE